MAFTQAWDEAVPVDTQLANLVGDNIRDDKRDTRERMVAFTLGALANRPTPEAVFGNASNGVLYWSSDENKLYQWSGLAWVDVSHLVKTHDYAITGIGTVVNPAVATDLMAVTIPANVLVANQSEVEIIAFYRISSVTSVSADFTFLIDGNVVGQIPFTTASPGFYMYHAVLRLDAAGNFAYALGVESGSLGGKSYIQRNSFVVTVSNPIICKVVVPAGTYTATGEFLRARVRR